MASQSDIQATHQIIQLFERSKLQTDDDLDSLPGIYAVIDLNGKIYKGNRALGALMSVDHELLLGRSMTELLLAKDWEHFRQEMQSSKGVSESVAGVQVDVTLNEVQFNYIWNFYPLSGSRRENLIPLFTVIGRDITERIEATQRNARMAHELEMASLIQRTLFPKAHSVFGESSIAGFYMSATECAGDWWYYKIMDDKLYIWIGDVEGHGVASAMITSAVRAAVSLIDRLETNPKKMLSVLSRVVLSVATDQKVMTFSIASIDLKTGEMIYANAAHEPGLLALNQTVAYKPMEIQGLPSEAAVPLGGNPDFPYVEGKIQLKRGDRVILFSDGVYDIMNKSGQKWTRTSLRRSLVPHLGSPTGALDLVKRVEDSINSFREGAQLIDDVTFAVFQY